MKSLALVLAVVGLAVGIGLAMRGRGSKSKAFTRTREPIAMVLLLIGLALFGVGWLVGVVLLWSSPVWRLRDKILGTLVIPGGLPMGMIFATFGLAAMFNSVSLTAITFVVYVLMAALFVLSPIYTAVHLGRRLVIVRQLQARQFVAGGDHNVAGR